MMYSCHSILNTKHNHMQNELTWLETNYRHTAHIKDIQWPEPGPGQTKLCPATTRSIERIISTTYTTARDELLQHVLQQ